MFKKFKAEFGLYVADLFRFSDRGPIPDVTIDDRDKWFPLLDGSMALLSNGVLNTIDNQQAGHWRDNEGLGIMDPDTAAATTVPISLVDLEFFDAIGWDVSTTITPGPPTLIIR